MADPKWLDYPLVKQHVSDGDLYADVINHYSGKLHYPDKMTDAHETSHMIHADIRNQHNLGFHGGGFYVGNNKACVMPAPNFRKSQVAPLVPRVLQESRYGTYVTGQREWDDNPLYLDDEWNAYVNGGRVCVELVQEGKYSVAMARRDVLLGAQEVITVSDHLGATRRMPMPRMAWVAAGDMPSNWTDGVMGLLEFSVYAVAVVLACNKFDPGFITSTPDFLAFTDFNLRRSAQIYALGSVMAEFKWDRQDKYLASLRTDPAAAEIRDALKQYFGGVWLSDTPAPVPAPTGGTVDNDGWGAT